MKKLLFFLSLLIASSGVFAQHRSEQEAMQIAQDFFAGKGKVSQLSVVPHQKVEAQVRKRVAAARKAPAQNQGFYVVNDETNNRFVIVSADERMYRILGYSDNGTFNEDKAPEGLLELMQGYNLQYDYLLSDESQARIELSRSPNKDIEPLVLSKWGQRFPYNLSCPENKKYGTGETCTTGCVATAMAQIMNYYKHPQHAQGGNYRYQMESQGEWLSADFNNISFDWEKILNEYNGNTTVEQNEAVAKLMFACGLSVSMDYGDDETGSSGAKSQNVPYALIHYFDYNPNTVYYNRAYFSDADWRSIIMEELESSRPIFYTGQGTGGHAFILDGCSSDGKFHFNFGADGNFDGYYELDAIRFQLYNFSYYQDMVCQISPKELGRHDDVFYSKMFDIGVTKVKVGNSVDFHFQPICYSSNSTYEENRVGTFDGEIGIGLFDEDLNYLTYLWKYNVNDIGIGEGYDIPRKFTLYSSDFKEGKSYKIAPYAKAKTSTTPTRIRTIGGLQDWYYATVDDGVVTLELLGPGIVPPVVTGDYNVSSNGDEKWNINIWQDKGDTAKYWIANIDPAVSKKGYTYESGWNKVYGYINKTHTQLSVPVNQEVGKDIVIKNISGGDNITIQLTEKDGKMYFIGISDLWGSKELSAESEMSRYQYSTITYGRIEQNPDPVSPPSIDVSSNSFTIHKGTDGSTIYYTLDNSIPNESSSRYNDEPIPLFHNCTIKAIAYKDGQKSEVTTVEVTFFKVETPDVHQDDNHITFTCATGGATIYYDWDGKTRQTGALDITKSGVIKVYAEKEYFNASDVKEQSLVYTPGIDDSYLNIANNEAGKLSTRISGTEKLSATRLTISGEINGTDVVFIRGMFMEGKLTDLDIENASIVSGGDPYDESLRVGTKDNIVGKYMFEDCKQMISIKLPSNAVKIEGGAFKGCKSLKRLDIPVSCIEVESMILSSCANLEEVNLSDAVQKFPGLAVYSCNNLMKINASEGNPYFKSVDGVLFSKDGKILVRYPMGKNDVAYTIPDGVVTIGKDAFDYAKIASITIPNTVTTIESSAFENCKNILTLAIPNSVTTIGSSAFSGCSKLDNVTMSSEVTSIESFTFGGCQNLRKFYIGEKVDNIDKLAFYNCKSLQEFVVDENSNSFTTQFGILYTKDMQELVKCPMALYSEECIVPNSVKVIRSESFATCTNIKKFYLPETLETIGECAFENCEMASIKIPQSVTFIGSSAFNKCNNLETIVLPEGTGKIENMTLHGCKSLSYVYIPAGVKSFGMWAIADCKLLTMINSQIKDVDDITVYYDKTNGYYDSFENIPDTCTWRVPSGPVDNLDKYVNKYKAQPWWVPTWRIVRDGEPEKENSIEITLSSELQTFCSDKNLDFTNIENLKAYIASGIDPKNNDVILSHVNIVPAKTGILLIGTAGQNYEVPFTDADFIYSNLFRGLLEDVEVTSGYVLEDGKKWFVAVDGTVTVKGGEAYLNVAPVANAPRLKLRFTDIKTLGIEGVLMDEMGNTVSWYTLQGVRLNGKPGKPGIYVHQGRKVVVK